MKHALIVCIIALLLTEINNPSFTAAQEIGGAEAVVECTNNLATETYKLFAEENDSFIFSPYSICTALGILYGGAKGRTADQIRSVLRFSGEDQEFFTSLADLQKKITGRFSVGVVELLIANALWPQNKYSLLEGYVKLLELLDAEISPLDYRGNPKAAQTMINNWANKKTNGRINDVLKEPPNPDTLLFLTNAIYFKGNWKSQFKKSYTAPQEPFWGIDGKKTKVAMMRQLQYFDYQANELVDVLEMPYIGNEFSMLILLPTEIDGIAAVENTMSAESLLEWSSQMSTHAVDVYLPRFEMTSEFDLKTTLIDMGVTEVFQPGQADLSGIDGAPNWLYLGHAMQKAFVLVNEEGSEAAAVTSGGGCFPAGTPVLTEKGPRPIENILPGQRIFSYDFLTGQWVLSKVQNTRTRAYKGDIVTIQTGSRELHTTGNHPFFVIDGEGLEHRPCPVDVPHAEQVYSTEGRWVAARNIAAGDTLKTRYGEIIITSLTEKQQSIRVYNLQVEKHHNYAVGDAGFLVHNKGSEEVPPVEFRVDHPFIFIIHDVPSGAILFMGKVGKIGD